MPLTVFEQFYSHRLNRNAQALDLSGTFSEYDSQLSDLFVSAVWLSETYEDAAAHFKKDAAKIPEAFIFPLFAV